MTITIKNARFSYRGLVPPEGDETPIAWSVSMRFQWSELPLQTWIAVIVGYDSQKLLPSPETIPPLTLKQWVSMVYGEPIGCFISDRTFLDEEIVFAGKTPREHVNFNAIYEDVPTGRRWGEADSTPLEDLAAMRESMMHPDVPIRHKTAVVKITDLDYATIEKRILGLASDRRVRAIVLDLDREIGEIPGPETHFAYLKSRRAGLTDVLAGLEAKETRVVATAAGKRDMGYLKHDRTKQHKRRRR